jgi:hypothetical protein
MNFQYPLLTLFLSRTSRRWKVHGTRQEISFFQCLIILLFYKNLRSIDTKNIAFYLHISIKRITFAAVFVKQ